MDKTAIARQMMRSNSSLDALFKQLVMRGIDLERIYMTEWNKKTGLFGSVLFVDDELSVCNAVQRALTSHPKIKFAVETVHVKPDGKDYLNREIIPKLIEAQRKGNPVRHIVLDVNLADIVDGPSYAVQLEDLQCTDRRVERYYLIDFLSGNRDKEQISAMTRGVPFIRDCQPFIKAEQTPFDDKLPGSLAYRTSEIIRGSGWLYAIRMIAEILSQSLKEGDAYAAAVGLAKRQLLNLPQEIADTGMELTSLLESALPAGVEAIGSKYTLDELASDLGLLNATRIVNEAGNTGNEEVAFKVQKNYKDGSFGLSSDLRVVPNVVERIGSYIAMYTSGLYEVIVLQRESTTQVVFKTTLKDAARIDATMKNISTWVQEKYGDVVRDYHGIN